MTVHGGSLLKEENLSATVACDNTYTALDDSLNDIIAQMATPTPGLPISQLKIALYLDRSACNNQLPRTRFQQTSNNEFSPKSELSPDLERDSRKHWTRNLVLIMLNYFKV